MSAVAESFFDRPLWQRLGVASVSLVVLAGLGYQYALSGMLNTRSELIEKKESLSSQIASEARIAQNLPQYQEQVATLESKLRIALEELPDEKDIPDLLKSIADLARDSGLEVLLFRPEAEERKDFFAEFPVSMSVEGSFHQVATFFDEVGRMPRIVNVRGIEVSNPRMTERGMVIKSDFSAVTFRFLSETEREAVDKEQADKKRRK